MAVPSIEASPDSNKKFVAASVTMSKFQSIPAANSTDENMTGVD